MLSTNRPSSSASTVFRNGKYTFIHQRHRRSLVSPQCKGGFEKLTFILWCSNQTPYAFDRLGVSSKQMDAWDRNWPASIAPYTCASAPVAFSTSAKKPKDDAGTAWYQIVQPDGTNPQFQIVATSPHEKEHHVGVSLDRLVHSRREI